MTEVKSSKVIAVEFIDLEEATELLSASSIVGQAGGLSAHRASCEKRGDVVLFQGSNGEFALVSTQS